MASKSGGAGFDASLQLADPLHPALFVEIEIDDWDPSPIETNYVRRWTGYGDYSWDSKTWTGVGDLMSIQIPEETTEVRAVNFQIIFEGIDSAKVSLALDDHYKNRPACVWFALFNASGTRQGDPVILAKGKQDTWQITDDGSAAQIVITVESELAMLERASERRYTAQDQQIDYASDTGFDWIERIQDEPIVWGSGQ